ncbi:hypothetical protein TPHA_0A05300 [Tetrapisispora phaffii CBS 4417]|uniref:Uncharacterized protein n=1 Tax=Tetrapisispora phaffii (strain ATCC 24235 / CBS 4417 / NBRC 1672 / NRRL Y-8282 / UCD 70-5) TaxID=1071381 RepID=G8BNX6_TETPH|nr:hypothetical protein TPHA_0A05300 [Tetrapisispora phaffii CBS 4417]CCE61604.1 hypothetical protein TPHA_0A05300 [Tetrapisispora phaffii CBS 4417]
MMRSDDETAGRAYSAEDYFEALCAEEENVHANYGELKKMVSILKDLTNEDSSDEELISKLKELEKVHYAVKKSTADLKFSKFKVRNTEVNVIENSKLNGNNDYQHDLIGNKINEVENIKEYIETIENLNSDLMIYTNLLGRLSVGLIQQVQVSNTENSEIMINDYPPPEEIVSILEKFNTETTETDDLRGQLDDYLQKIKMDRAKYTLENEYLLKDSLLTLSKEVNYWRKEYDNLEMLMFSDGPNTIMKMMKNVDSLRLKVTGSDSFK